MNFSKICHKDFDFYKILHKKCFSNEVYLRIPETLFYVSHGKHPIYFFNSEKGFICTDSSESSVFNFFSRVESIIKKEEKSEFPVYIHISKESENQLFFDLETAKKHFEQCPYRYHFLQRYIRVSSNFAWKVTVDWQNGSLKYFTISNNQPFIGSCFLPKNKKNCELKLENKFLVKIMNPKSYHVLNCLQPIFALNAILKQLTPFLLSFVFKKQPISEFLIDFIRESKDKWYFIDLKGYLIKGEHINQLSKQKRTFSITTKLIKYPQISINYAQTPPSSEESVIDTLAETKKARKISKRINRQASVLKLKKTEVNIPSIEEQWSLYLTSKKSDNIGRIPFNMIGIVPQKFGSHITSFVEYKRDLIPKNKSIKEPPLGMYLKDCVSVMSNAKYLSQVSENLDCVMKKAFEMKEKNTWNEKIKEIDEKIGVSLENVFAEFLVTAKDSDELAGLFENESQEVCNAKVKGFKDLLLGKMTKKHVEEIHHHLNISETQFNSFLKLLETTLRNNFVPATHLIIQKFKRFEKNIVFEF